MSILFNIVLGTQLFLNNSLDYETIMSGHPKGIWEGFVDNCINYLILKSKGFN
jgi:hypothetical protein